VPAYRTAVDLLGLTGAGRVIDAGVVGLACDKLLAGERVDEPALDVVLLLEGLGLGQLELSGVVGILFNVGEEVARKDMVLVQTVAIGLGNSDLGLKIKKKSKF